MIDIYLSLCLYRRRKNQTQTSAKAGGTDAKEKKRHSQTDRQTDRLRDAIIAIARALAPSLSLSLSSLSTWLSCS